MRDTLHTAPHYEYSRVVAMLVRRPVAEEGEDLTVARGEEQQIGLQLLPVRGDEDAAVY